MNAAASDMAEPSPPPWSDGVLELIKGYVTVGCSIPVACEAAGVKWSTAKNWLDKGKRGVQPYVLFADEMRRAQAMHKVGTRLIIMNAAKKGDWRAAAYLDERREKREERQREASAPLPEDERVVLLYPVPMPMGGDVSQLQLAHGHAIDTEGHDTTKGDDDED